MKESISTYSAIAACFNVYQDFFSYRTGVYRHVTGGLAGDHCVVLVGMRTLSLDPPIVLVDVPRVRGGVAWSGRLSGLPEAVLRSHLRGAPAMKGAFGTWLLS